jgi:hypothetical protein
MPSERGARAWSVARASKLLFSRNEAMKVFHCTCGQPLFFDNVRCENCRRQVAYNPTSRMLVAVEPAGEDLWAISGDQDNPPPLFRLCANRTRAAACNWLVPSSESHAICLSCRLTRTIPSLDRPKNAQRLRELEAAKRRVLFSLQNMQLPLIPKSEDEERGLAFDFLEALPDGPPVLIGHDEGAITLNIAEADDDYREKNREKLHEPYRTVVGHIRHELGHYFWDLLVRDTPWHAKYRAIFGDERADYAEALKKHYAEGPPANWRDYFISAYAASHPWEDWAESWAHFMHIRATLETVVNFGLDITNTPLRLTPFSPDVLYERDDDPAFFDRINTWVVLTALLNEVARSMGQPDIYPFVLNAEAVKKIHFVGCVIKASHGVEPLPDPAILAAPAR